MGSIQIEQWLQLREESWGDGENYLGWKQGIPVDAPDGTIAR